MHTNPALGQESDQIEDRLIIRLSTSAVTNFLLTQDAKFHVSSQISRVRCCAIKHGRKRYKGYTADDRCPHQDHIILSKKGKMKGISHAGEVVRGFFSFQGRKSTKDFEHQHVM